MKNKKIFIGIDPGQANGFAIKQDGKLNLETFKLYQLFECIDSMKSLHKEIQVFIENPNLWTNFKNSPDAASRLQGAGSVKGTYAHIAEYLTDRNIDFVGCRPDKTRNGYGAAKNIEVFQKLTGYTKRCSEHARVAAMLIAGCK